MFQVDLSEVPELGLELPKEGILQFFHEDDALYGMDLHQNQELAPNGLVRVINDWDEDVILNTPAVFPIPKIFYVNELSFNALLPHCESVVRDSGKTVFNEPTNTVLVL